MIFVIDISSIGKTHVVFNSSILNVLYLTFPEEKIIFQAEVTHLNYVRESTNDLKNLFFQEIYSSLVVKKSGNPLIRIFSKILEDKKIFFEIFDKMGSSPNNIIFLCSAPPLSFYIFKRLKKKYEQLVFAVLHGEIEYMFYSSNLREKIIGYIYKRALISNAKNFKYILLNKIALKKLAQNNLLRKEDVVEIDHPFVFKDDIRGSTHYLDFKKGIAIGQVGSMDVRKSAHLLYKVAEDLIQEINDNKLELITIGPVESNVLKYRNSLVKDFYSSDQKQSLYLNREVYEQVISSIDYSIFFYNKEQYIFRASGAICDVVAFEKPIIAIWHPYFDYLFNEVGNIGFLCKDLNEVENIIKRICNNDKGLTDQYYLQKTNLRKLKFKLSIATVAEDFKRQYNKMVIK